MPALPAQKRSMFFIIEASDQKINLQMGRKSVSELFRRRSARLFPFLRRKVLCGLRRSPSAAEKTHCKARFFSVK
jgi:hypothetical protein